MNIKILFENDEYSVDLSDLETVEDLKAIIFSLTFLEPSSQNLVVMGKILQDEEKINSLNLTQNQRVLLVDNEKNKKNNREQKIELVTTNTISNQNQNKREQQMNNNKSTIKTKTNTQNNTETQKSLINKEIGIVENQNPQEQKRMLSRITSYLEHVRQYESQTLQNKILTILPLEELLIGGEEQNEEETPPEYSQAKRIMGWFKKKFFKWTKSPECNFCSGATKLVGYGQPTFDERKYGAGKVECYCCSLCNQITRFPRYNSVEKLVDTKCGRCGEWANTFCGIMRAMGYDTRYILDMTDHVWVEVWIESLNRWIHFDCCENISDRPFTYEQGWKKKLTYVFAFSTEEVVDVTARYTKNIELVIKRRSEKHKISEPWLQKQLQLINNKLQNTLTQERKKIVKQRQTEELKQLNFQYKNRNNFFEEQRPRISGFEN
ncbi:peptide-n(4)-(n-acetyl-beta-glucosaminyl)asparagine amidase [Anaeramoeba flamelloides]|uniref:Peptide-n(4)-(N-acetyl-beta-glucosaminyl)asparagine amidase n=1 Tax=Anaeramoeba flamelloides TaxID=1746091 RepID=A0AAV8AA54_9EUKA|nr:peptide-n(4)-(n-acetyl-beta-glucosaminyl)asparagine amidase [Anaeramoeba flamelloides]